MRYAFILLSAITVAVVFHACSPSDRITPEPPTADFTVSTGLLGRDLMTLEQTTVFWESVDDSVSGFFAVKLEAVHDHADTYEWYIHTDPTPTATGPVYISGFSLAGLGATEWPVTIRTRLVASWAVGSDSVAKDTVDRQITLYDHHQNLSYIYKDTISYTGEHRLPPYMGRYIGHLASDPENELVVDINVPDFGPWPKRGVDPIVPCVFGLPSNCGNDIQAELGWKTDRHFTVSETKFWGSAGIRWEVCGHYQFYHGEYNPYTEELRIKFGYDQSERPADFDWESVWQGRVEDEFIGIKTQ